MMGKLRALASGTLLLLEVRRLRRDLAGLQQEIARIATAMELANAHAYPMQIQPDDGLPPVEVLHVDDAQQEEFMDIELRLTRAKGIPPSEEEILKEYELRRQVEGQERVMNG